MSENEMMQDYAPPVPNPDLKTLDPLVGTWVLSEETQGKITYEWMEGGFFLIQHYDFELGGHSVKGMEIIGHEQQFGAEPSKDIKSRIYDTQGNTFTYVYEMEGDTLTIWGGEKGSPAYYRGKFSQDGNRVEGEWVYPGGGGYKSNMTRVISS